MIKLTVGLIALSLLSACSSVPKQWNATDGSKADGKIIMTYLFRPILDTPPENSSGALEIAKTKCQAWGYESAGEFGTETKSCNDVNIRKDGSTGCTRWLIQKIYQCVN